jgi:hypothetical protein
MSKKINIIAAALLTTVAASEIPFGEFSSLQIGLGNPQAAVFDSKTPLTGRCGPRATMPPSDRTATDPTGDVISTDRNLRVCF